MKDEEGVVEYPFKKPNTSTTLQKNTPIEKEDLKIQGDDSHLPYDLNTTMNGDENSNYTNNNELSMEKQNQPPTSPPPPTYEESIDIFNLPDLKESSVDELDETIDIVDDLGIISIDDIENSSSNNKNNNINNNNNNNNNNSNINNSSKCSPHSSIISNCNNDTHDSDMLNITFSDDNIKQLIQNPNKTSQQMLTTAKESREHHNSTTDDESFEHLPHLGERVITIEKHTVNVSDQSHTNVVKISNTMGESQTDHNNDKPRHNNSHNDNSHSRLKLRRSISDGGKIDLSSYFNNNDNDNTKSLEAEHNRSRDDDTSFSNAALENNESTSSEDILKPLPTSFNTTTESINNVADLSSIEESEQLQSIKRRAVSVDNSQLTPSQTRRFKVNNNNNIIEGSGQQKQNDLNDSKVASNGKLLHARASIITKKPNLQRAHSMSDLLDVNRRREKKFNKRKGFSSKLYRSGSISNILDDHYEEKSKAMSHEHWSTVVGNPERWFYCWHPLLGVNNLLSNWQ